MKNVLYTILVLLLAVTTISAQTHNVTRGSKPATTKPSTTTSKKRTSTPTRTGNAVLSAKNSGRNQRQRVAGPPASSRTQTYTRPISSADKKRIIDNLISNMVYISGGTFFMGATSEQGSNVDGDESPIHQVTLSPFYLGSHEITQIEWEAVMGNNPSYFKGENLPVEQISWEDCQVFILNLNAMTGKNFRLPTEAEWEFAARGGNNGRGYKYAGGNDISSIGWIAKNSNHKTHVVGSKRPNELGLYDMSGNVCEWCNDWYGRYNSSPQTNPHGNQSKSSHVMRGGSFWDDEWCCRVSNRSTGDGIPTKCFGLRLAL